MNSVGTHRFQPSAGDEVNYPRASYTEVKANYCNLFVA